MNLFNFKFPDKAFLEFELSRKRFAINILLALGMPILAILFGKAFLQDRYIVALLLILMLLFLLVVFYLTRQSIQLKTKYIIYQISFFTITTLMGISLIYVVGVEGKFSRTQWAYLYPLLAFFMLGGRNGLIWVLCFYFALILSVFYFDTSPITMNQIDELKLRFFFSLLLVSALVFFLEYIIRRDRRKLLDNQVILERSEHRYREAYEKLRVEVSERKQADEEKKQLEDQLQRAQKMEALGTLAGGVAHDLNNVLSGIVSYPDLLLMDIPEDSPLREPILTIQTSGNEAAAIVQDLLTLSRRGVTTTEVVNLNDVIDEYLKSPEHTNLVSYHPNIEVEINLEQNLLNILGSTLHLSKTVMNLVSNSAEAMPDGGKICISTDNRYIDTPINGYENIEEGDYITLMVSDTGSGISPEDTNRIFEPFYTKKHMGRSGTGLGMAVVWGTVQDHHGYIHVESAEGKGTTIELYFPITREGFKKDKAKMPIENYRGNGELILVVDDVKKQREIATHILTKLSYTVKSVSSGKEAIEYIKQKPVDILVLDMIMDPGIDGLDTYKEIIKISSGQKAIIASGFAENERVREAQRLGAGQYIKKPYTLQKIGLAIKHELSK